VGDEGRKKD